MPLLPLEASVYPQSFFELEGKPGGERHLHVLQTRPRQEKSVSRQLLKSHIPFYLPLLSRRLRYRNRRMTSHVPLFPGYIFLYGDGSERLAALKTSRIVRSLEVADEKTLWFDLRQIHQLIETGAAITPEDRLSPGAPIEIRHGPLAGLRGRIIKEASGQRFIVEVHFIQRCAAVLLDQDTLIPCAEADLDVGP